MTKNSKQAISWQAPEFKTYEKNAGWYTTLVAVAVIIIGYFIIQRDYFAALTMAIIAALLVFFSRQQPQVVDIELGPKAVRFGNIKFPYQQIKHFWIVHSEHHKTLNLETTTYLNNLLILELEEQDPEEISEFLKQFLPEHPSNTEPTFAQKVMHKLKF